MLRLDFFFLKVESLFIFNNKIIRITNKFQVFVLFYLFFKEIIFERMIYEIDYYFLEQDCFNAILM